MSENEIGQFNRLGMKDRQLKTIDVGALVPKRDRDAGGMNYLILAREPAMPIGKDQEVGSRADPAEGSARPGPIRPK